jgi:phosphopantetheinyl transferase (holo-ACP synthase)
LGRDRASTARYTLVIQKTYGYNSGIEIEDSQRMEFATKEAALKYVSKGIPGGYTWHIIDPPNST